MNVGDRVGVYRLTQAFSNVGGGQSEWAFAERGGNSYFIKRFLKPTYPVDGGPGSERGRARKREECERFERHHRAIQQLLKPLSASGGNLVVTRDFFRHGAHYFKVTERIDREPLALNQIAALPLADITSLMIAVAGSLRILHRNRLVHGDVKPDNVLLTRSSAAAYGAKLIDFDNCFPSGSPPVPDEMVGDPAYYSPEMMAYLTGGASAPLTQASDVFALALVFSQYLTGRLPVGKHPGYLAESVLRGGVVEFPRPAAAGPIVDLMGRMALREPEARPDVGEVWTRLKAIRGAVVKGLLPDGRSASPSPGGAPQLRGKLLEQSRKKDRSR